MRGVSNKHCLLPFFHLCLTWSKTPKTSFFRDVANMYHLYFRKVNVGDCVDFDCDAKSKNLHLQDKDGTLFGTVGTPGAYVPDAAFQWEGQWPGEVDPRRGAGDYRIPATALLDYLTGSYIQPRVVCTVIGNSNLTLSFSPLNL